MRDPGSCIVGSNRHSNAFQEVILVRWFHKSRASEMIFPGRSRSSIRIRTGSLACVLASVPGCAHRLPSPVPQPPSNAVIQRITWARNVFLSNAGANDYFNSEIPGAPNVVYNELYAAIRQWGYFHLADSPAHADLIFQICGTEAAPQIVTDSFGDATGRQHQPYLQLTILDPGNNPNQPARIDRISVLAGRAGNLANGRIALAHSVEWLTYQLSTRVALPPARSSGLNPNTALRPSFETLLRSVAPVPPQFLNARSVYLEAGPPARDGGSTRNVDLKHLQSDLAAWGYYHLVSTPEAADVVFHLNSDPYNGVSITVTLPHSTVILWAIDDPRLGLNHSLATVDRNLVSLLKQIHHIPLTRAETASLR